MGPAENETETTTEETTVEKTDVRDFNFELFEGMSYDSYQKFPSRILVRIENEMWAEEPNIELIEALTELYQLFV